MGGHFTGEITLFLRDEKYKQLSFSNDPITAIYYEKGYIYFASHSGLFKRQPIFSLGISYDIQS